MIIMVLQKLNLTEIKINKQLDLLALIHPNQTCKILLKNLGFRKDLLNYVMKSIPNEYLVIEIGSNEEFSEICENIKCTNSEKSQIYNLTFQRFNELRSNKRKIKNSPSKVLMIEYLG